MKVFLSMPSEDTLAASTLATKLMMAGHEVLSTWHRNPYCEKYPTDPAVRLEQLEINMRGIEAADVVVAASCTGIPRTTLSEIGYAIAKGRRVVWLQPFGPELRTLFDAHPLVTRLAEPSVWSVAVLLIVAVLEDMR